LYRPRHDREAERCWHCVGMTAQEHVNAIKAATGEPVIAHRYGARPERPPQADNKPPYLVEIERLLN
jgi:hypothetical protein